MKKKCLKCKKISQIHGYGLCGKCYSEKYTVPYYFMGKASTTNIKESGLTKEQAKVYIEKVKNFLINDLLKNTKKYLNTSKIKQLNT